MLCTLPLHKAQTLRPAEGDTWHTPSSLPSAPHQKIQDQIFQIHLSRTGTDRKAGTAPLGWGRHGATAHQVAAQRLGRSSGLKQSEETVHPQKILHGLNPNLENN